MEEESAENSCSLREDSVQTEGNMPRDGKRGKKSHGHLSSDITLQNFADCSMPQACSRVRKSVIGATAAIGTTSGAQAMEPQETEDQDWFDKDFDSFVIPDKETEEEDLAAAEIAAERAERLRRGKERKGKEKDGIVYPSDLWFHLSNFIDPLDVGRFSGICSCSYAVTKTAAFWRQLYFRLYNIKVKEKRDCLPAHLRPARIEKLNGLRARVVSALFRIHSPLVDRIKAKGPMDAEPHDLTGYRCLLAWHQPGTKGWQFCFKLQKPSLFARNKQSTVDLKNGYTDIFDNPEEGCCVLQVICCHFASVPPVMGLLLKKVYMTLSVGFRHHRLRLHFDSSVASLATQMSVSDVVANLDDVIGVKVIRWWDPAYPFTP